MDPFHTDGWGNHDSLDTAQSAGGECPVVFWNHDLGPDQQPERTHASYLDWLEHTVKNELEYEGSESHPG